MGLVVLNIQRADHHPNLELVPLVAGSSCAFKDFGRLVGGAAEFLFLFKLEPSYIPSFCWLENFAIFSLP